MDNLFDSFETPKELAEVLDFLTIEGQKIEKASSEKLNTFVQRISAEDHKILVDALRLIKKPWASKDAGLIARMANLSHIRSLNEHMVKKLYVDFSPLDIQIPLPKHLHENGNNCQKITLQISQALADTLGEKVELAAKPQPIAAEKKVPVNQKRAIAIPSSSLPSVSAPKKAGSTLTPNTNGLHTPPRKSRLDINNLFKISLEEAEKIIKLDGRTEVAIAKLEGYRPKPSEIGRRLQLLKIAKGTMTAATIRANQEKPITEDNMGAVPGFIPRPVESKPVSPYDWKSDAISTRPNSKADKAKTADEVAEAIIQEALEEGEIEEVPLGQEESNQQKDISRPDGVRTDVANAAKPRRERA